MVRADAAVHPRVTIIGRPRDGEPAAVAFIRPSYDRCECGRYTGARGTFSSDGRPNCVTRVRGTFSSDGRPNCLTYARTYLMMGKELGN